MEKVFVKDIARNPEKFAGNPVRIQGWIRTLRSSNAFGFIELNDGSFFKNIQVVFEDKLENFKELTKLTIAAAVTVEGVLEMTPDAKQPYEIKATQVIIEAESNSD